VQQSSGSSRHPGVLAKADTSLSIAGKSRVRERSSVVAA
jgi:hypothetical protein